MKKNTTRKQVAEALRSGRLVVVSTKPKIRKGDLVECSGEGGWWRVTRIHAGTDSAWLERADGYSVGWKSLGQLRLKGDVLRERIAQAEATIAEAKLDLAAMKRDARKAR